MALEVYEYADVDVLLTRIMQSPGGAVLGMDQRSAVLRRVRAASARINAYCGRVFTPTTLTRVLDAPVPPAGWTRYLGGGWDTLGGRLSVPDLQTVTSVTAFGTTLVADTDYHLVHYRRPDGTPGDTALLRVNGGAARSWYFDADGPWQPLGAVSVTGVWCYDLTTIPYEVVTVTEALVLKDWQRYIRSYTAGASSADDVTLDPDLAARLDPYKMRSPQVVFA